jgi:hypothetical protein
MPAARGSASRLWWQLRRAAPGAAGSTGPRHGAAGLLGAPAAADLGLGCFPGRRSLAAGTANPPSPWPSAPPATRAAHAASAASGERGGASSWGAPGPACTPRSAGGAARHPRWEGAAAARGLPPGLPLLLPARPSSSGAPQPLATSSLRRYSTSGGGSGKGSGGGGGGDGGPGTPSRRWAGPPGGRFVRGFSRDAEMGDDVEGLAAQLGSFSRQGINRQGTPTFEVRGRGLACRPIAPCWWHHLAACRLTPPTPTPPRPTGV